MSAIFLSPFGIPIVAIIAVFAWMSVSAIVAGVKSIVKHRNETELKQMLVDRGLSAEEIERIVQVSAIDSPEEGNA